MHMAQDRADLAFAAKELAKNMARPKQGDEIEAKRVIRYLRAKPRGYVVYPWQGRPTHLNVYCTLTQVGLGMLSAEGLRAEGRHRWAITLCFTGQEHSRR